MARSVWEKVKEHIMPSDLEDEVKRDRQMSLELHSQPQMKVIVLSPAILDQTCRYADSLQEGLSLVVDYAGVDSSGRQTMHDFLKGVCYILRGQVQVISSEVILYVPNNVSISCEKMETSASFFSFDKQQLSPRIGLN